VVILIVLDQATEASAKVRRGNYERIFEGKTKSWEAANMK
jgi:hypothetical protein